MNAGWAYSKLGEECDFVRGPFGGNLKKSCFVDEGYAVYEQQHAIYDQFHTVRYFVDKNKFSEMKRFELRSGDLIMSCSGTIGKVAIVPDGIKHGIINQALLKLTPHKSLDAKFVKLWMESEDFRVQITKHSKGVAIKNVASVKTLKTIDVPLPPLAEQKRIVSILDEAFGAIAKAKENAERNLANAKELFESYLNKVFTEKGEGWEEKTLEEVTTKIGSGATPKGGKNAYKEEGISLVRSLNVHDRSFRMKKLAFIDDQQAEKLANVILEAEDVLLNITGASVTRCCVLPESILPARVNQHVSILRTIKDQLHPSFLCFLLTSKEYKDQLLATGEKGGATRQAITKSQIQKFVVAFPPSVEIQKRICLALAERFVQTVRLEQICQQKLADLDELKQSILQKAFTGQLTSKSSELQSI